MPRQTRRLPDLANLDAAKIQKNPELPNEIPDFFLFHPHFPTKIPCYPHGLQGKDTIFKESHYSVAAATLSKNMIISISPSFP